MNGKYMGNLRKSEINSLIEFSKKTEYDIEQTYTEWIKYNNSCIYADTIDDMKDVGIFEYSDDEFSITIFKQPNNNYYKRIENITDKYINGESGFFFNNYQYDMSGADSYYLYVFTQDLSKVKFKSYKNLENIKVFKKDLGGCELNILFESKYIEDQLENISEISNSFKYTNHHLYDIHGVFEFFLDHNILNLDFKPSTDILRYKIRERNIDKLL